MYRAYEQLPHESAQAGGRVKTIRRINCGGEGYYMAMLAAHAREEPLDLDFFVLGAEGSEGLSELVLAGDGHFVGRSQARRKVDDETGPRIAGNVGARHESLKND